MGLELQVVVSCHLDAGQTSCSHGHRGIAEPSHTPARATESF